MVSKVDPDVWPVLASKFIPEFEEACRRSNIDYRLWEPPTGRTALWWNERFARCHFAFYTIRDSSGPSLTLMLYLLQGFRMHSHVWNSRYDPLHHASQPMLHASMVQNHGFAWLSPSVRQPSTGNHPSGHALCLTVNNRGLPPKSMGPKRNLTKRQQPSATRALPAADAALHPIPRPPAEFECVRLPCLSAQWRHLVGAPVRCWIRVSLSPGVEAAFC